MLYESLLLFGVMFSVTLVFSVLAQFQSTLNPDKSLQVLLFVVSGLYFTWFWSHGQTLAMKTWRIRLVDRKGQTVTPWRAVLRYLLCWVWVLPPVALASVLALPAKDFFFMTAIWVALWALLSRLQAKRQFWHDVWAGTQLVSDPP